MTKAAEKDFVETPETASSVFDFATRDSAAKAEEGAELKVVDPLTGDGVGVFITLAGADSAVHRKASATITKRRVNKAKGFRSQMFDPGGCGRREHRSARRLHPELEGRHC